ncbi:hypothetical protein, partial [Citrobacter freundii]
MAVYSTAVSPLYFTDEQTETIKPALTCRGSPYRTNKACNVQNDAGHQYGIKNINTYSINNSQLLNIQTLAPHIIYIQITLKKNPIKIKRFVSAIYEHHQ